MQRPSVRNPGNHTAAASHSADKTNPDEEEKKNIRLREGKSRGETKEAFVGVEMESRTKEKGTERFNMLLTLRGFSQLNALMETSGREISQIYSGLLLGTTPAFLRDGNEAKGGVKVGRGKQNIGISQAPPTAKQPRSAGFYMDHVEGLIHLPEQESGNGDRQRRREGALRLLHI